MEPNLAFGQFAVPNDYSGMSEWLNSHLSRSGGRYILLPYGGMSNEAVSSFIPEISSVTLPVRLWNELITSENNSLILQTFSQNLALLGVKYVIINKGPYVAGDSQLGFIGPARVGPVGFLWDQSYLPYGSWQNWSLIFKSDSYLKPIMNQQNWLVLENPFFTGLFHAYIFPDNFCKSDITSITSNGSILYSNSSNSVPLNFSILPGPFRENWTRINNPNGTVSYVGGPLPANMTYSNIYEQVFMKKSSYYNLKYSMAGVNMSRGEIFLRFYAGTNLSGNVIATYSLPIAMGNESYSTINYVFKTPDRYNSSAIFLTYASNPSEKFYEYSFEPYSLIYQNLSYPISSPLILNYSFITPTKLFVNMDLPKNTTVMILYSTTFDPAWVMTYEKYTYDSQSFSLYPPLAFNSFLLYKNVSTATISFKAQGPYVVQLITTGSILISLVTIFVAVVVLDKRRTLNVPK